MPLAPGARLGPYEITAPIGRGGMGEVYRARDGKLGRDVAIKVLPEEFAQDTERLTRFEREAKLLASLNHPNIAGIYGLEESDGVKALVLELVDGPTLADRVAQGAIPIDEALPIANQVAEALEAGHEAGVVHRDLKPANIKLKEDGTVKVLDYGLAKALGGDAASATDSDLSQSPTLTRQGTQIGVILGTAPYMSPEQAKGKRIDKRTDIWAFGAVLYEMLTAKRAFAGDDVSDTLAAVLRAEPDFAALPVETPRAVVRILRLCLEKDPKERARDIGDVRLAMKGAFETEAKLPPSVSEPVGWRPSRALALASALAAVTAAVVWNLEPETPRPLVRASIVLPSEVLLDSGGRHMVAISPDGSRLAVTARDQIYLRPIDRTEVTPLGGTSGARSPFFSPDGEWLGFWSIQDGQLKKVAIRGGAAVSLCTTTQAPWGARWGADGAIVFGQTPNIVRVSADGGTPEVLVAVDDGVAHGPQVLPGGRDVLFTLGDGSNWDDARIVVHSLETGEREVLIERGRDARYVPSGHLVYVLDGTLMAVPFDADALEVTGGPVPMAEKVMTARATTGAAEFSVSDTGSLVYLTQGPEERRTLVWVDREGNEEVLIAEPRAYEVPRISPDGDRVAFSVAGGERDIWIWEFARKTVTRFTFAAETDTRPLWTPDGEQIVFESHREGEGNLFAKGVRGNAAVERLTSSRRHQQPLSISPDGTTVLLEDSVASPRDLSILRLLEPGEPQPLLHSEFNETNAEFSPDGRFVAYQSDESGRYDIYVRPFPNFEDRLWQVSTQGGAQPLWAPNGRELFYVAPDGRLMTVPIEIGDDFAYGNPTSVFGTSYSRGRDSRNYDISPDGERFLMVKESGTSSSELTLVLNWFEELKRRVPANN